MSKAKKTITLEINPKDTPIYYTDNINIVTNEDGVVLQFCQPKQPGVFTVVSRIGMSWSHAEKFISKLGGVVMKEKGLKTSSKVKN